MSDLKFTRGPLTPTPANDRTGDVGLLDDQRNVVAECFAAIRSKDERADEEALANARLFAHAQLLLTALHALVDRDFTFFDRRMVGCSDPITQQQVRNARAAIALALGTTDFPRTTSETPLCA